LQRLNPWDPNEADADPDVDGLTRSIDCVTYVAGTIPVSISGARDRPNEPYKFRSPTHCAAR